jgi:glycosyltransferase involved in cell wall biosynthesis
MFSSTEAASPKISIVIPCLNEEKSIGPALRSLMDDWTVANSEVILVDGGSVDRTRKIALDCLRSDAPFSMKVLLNPQKIQSFGLNLGIREAQGQFIVRADAHCIYPAGYVRACVTLLDNTGAANVGGVMVPVGVVQVQKAIALAMQHPVGVGDAQFHLGNFTGYVDTVYLGTFRKKLFDDIGLYDTNCSTNEDAELNLRILETGRKIYLDSSIQVTYFPRQSLKELAKQYFKYGKGRCYTILKHKKATSWRQIAPVVLVIILSFSMLLSPVIPALLLIPLIYLGALLLISFLSWPSKKINLKIRFLMGLAFAVMHVSWGIGFLSKLMAPRAKIEIVHP